MSLYNNCLGTTWGCAMFTRKRITITPQLIPDLIGRNSNCA